MDSNPIHPRVRFAIYIVTGIAAIVVSYLSATHIVDQTFVTSFTALSAFVNGLAAANVRVVQ